MVSLKFLFYASNYFGPARLKIKFWFCIFKTAKKGCFLIKKILEKITAIKKKI